MRKEGFEGQIGVGEGFEGYIRDTEELARCLRDIESYSSQVSCQALALYPLVPHPGIQSST